MQERVNAQSKIPDRRQTDVSASMDQRCNIQLWLTFTPENVKTAASIV